MLAGYEHTIFLFQKNFTPCRNKLLLFKIFKLCLLFFSSLSYFLKRFNLAFSIFNISGSGYVFTSSQRIPAVSTLINLHYVTKVTLWVKVQT